MQALPKIVKFGLTAGGVIVAGLTLGFVFFAVIATREMPTSTRSANGIVVLTGGVQRIAEAGRLFEQGKAKRLLVSGINKKTTRRDVLRLLKIRKKLFACCVDLGYSSRLGQGSPVQERDRRHRELSYATQPGRARRFDAGRDPDRTPGRAGQIQGNALVAGSDQHPYPRR
jgi:hypothetical protein